MNKTIKGVVFASAVASMFASAAFAEDKMPKKDAKAADGTEIRCAGVNECKGKGACGGANHGCAGENACKGKGWIKLSEKECKAKKGTVVADKT